MNPVITKEQAKQITNGRTPLIPVEYEQAVTALQACTSIDDSKYWADKADALAAWAKIYRSDEAGRKAAQLKLHAYRRMGQLATELKQGRKITEAGPRMLLVERGLTLQQAKAAMYMARISERTLSQIISQERPLSPVTIRQQSIANSGGGKSVSLAILQGSTGGTSLRNFAAWCARNSAKSLALGLHSDEREQVRSQITSAIEWLDELEVNLPK